MAQYFVRHGQTPWNAEKRIMGHADISLNDEGRRQTEKVRDQLAETAFAAIIVSPLLRARETAEIIAQSHPDTPLIVASELKERDFGEYEGRVNDGNYFGLWNYSKDIIEQGETTVQLLARVSSFLDTIQEKYSDSDILLVAHGGVGVTVEAYYHGLPEDGNLLTYVSGNGEVRCYESRER